MVNCCTLDKMASNSCNRLKVLEEIPETISRILSVPFLSLIVTIKNF